MNKTDIEKLVYTRDEDLLSEFPDHTREELRRLKRKHRFPIEFRNFLAKGRTTNEIRKKFGEKGVKMLSKDFDGFSLFHQEDIDGEVLHILLPKAPPRIKVKKRAFEYHIGVGENGEKQPYLLVKLPEQWKEDKMTIVPLFDVHYGHRECRVEKFNAYLEWIRDNDDVFVILGGDLMENALDDGRGMSYDQVENPDNQLNDLTILLAPIAHKCLMILPGNHEWRTYRKSGIDPTRLLAERLDIPYFDGPVYLSVQAGGNRWKAHVRHGRTGAATKGGKINTAAKPRAWTDFVHFIVMGHVHDPSITSEVCMVEDPVHCRLDYKQQWVVITQSFLGWERTYAYRGEFAPSGKGGVALEIFRWGGYRAELR